MSDGLAWRGRRLPDEPGRRRSQENPLSPDVGGEPFAQGAGSKVRVRWIDGGSAPAGGISGGRHWHGFPGRENAVVGVIIGFATGVR